MELQEGTIESTRMESISIDATSIPAQNIIHRSTLLKRSLCICILKKDTLHFWICMHTQRERESSYMEIRRMSCQNRLMHAYSRKYCRWIVCTLSIKGATLQKRICIARKKMIMFRRKELGELHSLKQQRIQTVGQSNATTTWAEFKMSSNLKKHKKRRLKNLPKQN